MRHTTLVHLRKLENWVPSEFDSLFYDINKFTFDSTNGYGFVNTDKEGNIFSSTLVQRRTTYRTAFDPSSNTFSRQENVYFERIPFFVDLGYGTIDVLSNAKNTRRLITLIGQILNFGIAVSDINVLPTVFLQMLAQANKPFELTKLTVNNFATHLGVSGRYTATVTNTSSGLGFIERHKADVLKIVLALNFDVEDEVELTFAKNGSIAVSCDEDNLLYILSEVKNLLFGDKENG